MKKLYRRSGRLNERYDIRPEEFPVVVDKIIFCLHSFSGINALGENESEDSKADIPLKRTQSSHSTTVLPFPHRVQMVKQIRGLLLLHQQNFFAKISQILYLRFFEQFHSKPTNVKNIANDNKTNLKAGLNFVRSQDL